MTRTKTKLLPNFGGPLHYLGNRFLSLPSLSGHMNADHTWLNEMFSLIFANLKQVKYRKCYEPFAGSASWSLAAMELEFAEEYVINDSDAALINTLRLMHDNPEGIKKTYTELEYAFKRTRHRKNFIVETINNYNKADQNIKSLLLPFIINYSWSGIIFHDEKGNISYREHQVNNQIIPGYLAEANLTLADFYSEVDRVADLLSRNKVYFHSGDFLHVLTDIRPEDFVALNPPYPENQRSREENTGMYRELYSPENLHYNLMKTMQHMDKDNIDYFMTYGFYDPTMKAYVIKDDMQQMRHYFRILGYPDCAFGMALDQMYFPPKYAIPNILDNKIISAAEILANQDLSPQHALKKFQFLAENAK